VGPAADDTGVTPASQEATGRNVAVMSVGTLLSRATGLVRVSVTLAALGLTTVSDAYNAANTTPNVIYELILGGILTSVFVPVIVDWVATHGRAAQWEVASRFLTIALVVLSGVAVLGAVAAPWIMRLYLAGVEPLERRQQAIELGVVFLRWFMPQIVFYGIGAIAGGVLTANRRFAAQMFAPILNNVAVIVTMLVFIASRDAVGTPPAGLTGGQQMLLGLGTTLGVVAMTVALWPSLRSLGFRWRLRFDWRHETVTNLLRLSRWVFLYVVANQAAFLVIINQNARIGEGAITAYSQAFVFFSLPHAIVAVSIFTALLPGLAERWSAGDPGGVRELFSRGLRQTEVLMLPAAAGLVALAGPIVALLAEYGAIGRADRALLARTLTAFAVGLPFFSAFQLLTRTYYASHDGRTPALVNVGVGVVNVGANVGFAFALGFGVPGLALGHATSYLVGTAALLLLLRPRLHGIDGPRIASTLARTFVASVATGAAAFATARVLSEVLPVDRPAPRAAQVGASVAAGVLAFLVSALILRVREVDEVTRALVTRFRR
jgi:putative peptidoglycan lipid II flippase